MMQRSIERLSGRGGRWCAVALMLTTTACESDLFVGGGDPAPPRDVTASYFEGAITLRWELAPDWNGESFRVYGKRVSDPDFFLIAEVTSCAGGVCSYVDLNVVPGQRYEYFVSAVDPDTGIESDSDVTPPVAVPQPNPPPVPGGLFVVALDGAAFIEWDAGARDVSDFSFYRVYLDDPSEGLLLLGETDSEGFLDLLASNGITVTYRVSAVDDGGHESDLSAPASGTPRPDFHGELLFGFQDRPAESGFRFQEDDLSLPVLGGADPDRHFRLEVDAGGWWLAPGPGTRIHAQGFETTTLKCGVTPDPGCSSLDVAPTGGYTGQRVAAFDQTTYPMEVIGDDGQLHYGVVRIVLLGRDQVGAGLMIFDWAYQIQPGNPELAPRPH